MTMGTRRGSRTKTGGDWGWVGWGGVVGGWGARWYKDKLKSAGNFDVQRKSKKTLHSLSSEVLKSHPEIIN